MEENEPAWSQSDMDRLTLLAAKYLDTLPDNDGEEIYASYRELAREPIARFVAWLQLRARGLVVTS